MGLFYSVAENLLPKIIQSRESLNKVNLEANEKIKDNFKDKTTENAYSKINKIFYFNICWGNVAKYAIFHIGAIYGFYLCVTISKWMTIAWGKNNLHTHIHISGIILYFK